MKNYVISLTTAAERRAHIAQEFGKQGVEFEFFDAITPAQNAEVAKHLGVDIDKANLSAGEISCLLSHLCLWQKMIDDDLDYIAIFEDDVYLGENAHQFLSSGDWLPNSAHIIKLETFLTPVLLKNSQPILGRQLSQLHYSHYGAAGYILSRQCIFRLFELLKQQTQITALDDLLCALALREPSLQGGVWQVNPALCIQSNMIATPQSNQVFASSLDSHRQTHHFDKPKRTLGQKIIREIKALFNKTRLKLFGEIVAFK
ncbi:hypothetical protein B0181_09355 [Moraxella caviae]|uniref:Lipooligosaccharide biosynthesis protein lex-1 n=1 Tax=Moraxella caviae TaxID=34060 RepID=A0A1S9ZWX7_9GAMM|nr:glycosyltransferase family 25 protein [Moraxella caviae]OOR87897.1 hypothetical protein B0181_09355 [Moraxella caviae]STZ14604.1 Lipooligosaccharide biosynthesis protein lex-1 [Moraxella caviae]VEW11373.1 Lipooligosaccharide biosynthesis protein lex-1 [Moraxella caviae]